MKRTIACALALLLPGAFAWAAPEAGTHGHYLVLSAKVHTPPPFAAVDFLYGPRERVDGAEHQWWQLEVRTQTDFQSTPLLQLRGLTSRDPLASSEAPLIFARYLLRIAETDEALEYRDAHSGRALLPAWREFQRHFLPRAAQGSDLQDGVAETLAYLGHVLTLQHVGRGVAWEAWDDARALWLDRELLVGTGRNFKDAERRRLPQEPKRQNYTYVPFTRDDYTTMIEAGINLFTITPDQEPWVRGEPVFFLKGAPAVRYPADLYRSNYIGTQMFMDEPSIIMVGDEHINKTLRYFSDAGALIEKRVRSRYHGAETYGAFQLEKGLIERGANFGDMRLEQCDYPSWETLYETAFYQMAGGLAGIVHEGRYQLAEFDRAVAKWTGTARRHAPEEMLRWHYAHLRGGTRPFGKHWGTSIYGQADPALSPAAVRLAYDMGARYVWFWTSDHDHHLPWPEQLDLARTLRDHARAHPRPSIFRPPPVRDTAIVIPYGYFLSFENLWWVRVLDREGKNDASQRYARLMRRALTAAHEAFERGEDYDITVDNGRTITGYRRVVRLSDAE